jgi:hypothetical protein
MQNAAADEFRARSPPQLFVDGENFTIRAQELAQKRGELIEGEYYKKDVFIWFPGVPATGNLLKIPGATIRLEDHCIRAYYYTSATGDDSLIASTENTLWERGFSAEIFKKAKGNRSKVSISRLLRIYLVTLSPITTKLRS